MHCLHPSAKEARCRGVQPLSDDTFDDDGFHVLYPNAKVVVFLKVGLTQFHRRHQLLAQLPHLNVKREGTHCNALQCTATHCNTLQRCSARLHATTTQCNTPEREEPDSRESHQADPEESDCVPSRQAAACGGVIIK